jgi:Tol biopolymer transport system component
MQQRVMLPLLVLALAACDDLAAPSEPIDGRPAARVASLPNPGRIAFSSNADGDWEIYVMSPNGSGLTQLTHNGGYDQSPSWYQQSQIAFTTNRNSQSDIYTMKADGTGQTRRTTSLLSLMLWEQSPAWSPAGDRIAFLVATDIWIMNVDGTGMTNLTHDAAWDKNPGWSPDGSRIVFISNRNGNDQVFTMKPDGTDLQQVTQQAAIGGRALHPNWSPDGQWITFARFGPDGMGEIYKVKPDGSQTTQLTHTAASEMTPVWSRDSQRLAYIRGDDIWIMAKDGTGPVNVTHSAGVERDPSWSR